MKGHLQISDTLSLPLSYATSRNMCLAQSGAGKSNACVVIAEEMYRNKIPWVAIDTKGDWYGIRSNRSGKQRGLDVPVFGGEFGDMPLSPAAGIRMAELVAAGKFQGVLDVSDFPKASDVSRFLTEFANTLLKKQRTPVHLFLEECADYLPQGGFRGQLDPMAAACVGAMKRLATKGRFRGIGYTLISQRAAEVNKTVLYQCETLIALRMVGDLDIKWIEGWVKRGSKRAPELLSTLHELANGEGWIWSPGKFKIIERVHFCQRQTFDSGAEPEIGKARVVPKMAPVELDALRRELADLEEQAKADDPKELRRKIAELEAKAKSGAASDPKEVIQLRARVHELEMAAKNLDREKKEVGKTITTIRSREAETARLIERLSHEIDKLAFATVGHHAGLPEPLASSVNRGNKATRGRSKEDVIMTVSTGGPDPAIGKGGLLRMMIALAQKPGLTRRQLAIRAGMAMSGTFSTYLSRGKTENWITDSASGMELTNSGLHALGRYDPLPGGDDLFEYWFKEIGGGGVGAMMRALRDVYPNALSRSELASRSGLAESGTFSTYLSKLRGYELIEGKAQISLARELVD